MYVCVRVRLIRLGVESGPIGMYASRAGSARGGEGGLAKHHALKVRVNTYVTHRLVLATPCWGRTQGGKRTPVYCKAYGVCTLRSLRGLFEQQQFNARGTRCTRPALPPSKIR